MKVIKDFLNQEEFDLFLSLVNECKDVQPEIKNNDDDAIKGLNKTKFINPSMEFLKWWIDILKQKNIIDKNYKIGRETDLTIVEADYPYEADWHKDSFMNISIGIILFYFSEEWNFDDGGLFLTKDDNDKHGSFVVPDKNVLVTNPTDKLHAVTKISNKEKTRKSIVLFLSQECFV
jgi:hypothetical protein